MALESPCRHSDWKEASAVILRDQARRLRHQVTELGLSALAFAPRAKIDEVVRGWLARADIDPESRKLDALMSDAMAFSCDLAMFQPSASGTTAIDRFLRQHRPGPEEAEAVRALRQATLRLVRVGREESAGVVPFEDLAGGEALRVFDESIPPEATDRPVLARTCPLDGANGYVLFGPIVPLDAAGLAVAMGFAERRAHPRTRWRHLAGFEHPGPS